MVVFLWLWCFQDKEFVVFIAGETLQDERLNGGAFIGTDGVQFPHKLIPVSFTFI